MSRKLVLRLQWNETFRTCRDPFDTKKFSNLSPKILVEWIAPKVSASVWNSHRTSLWTRRRKTNADSRFLMNKIIRSILTSYKHRHRYYGHHSNFRTANFYMKNFWKRTWPPTVVEFRMISLMTWLARDSKLQPIKSPHFSGRARVTGKFEKTRQFLTPKKTKGMRSRI